MIFSTQKVKSKLHCDLILVCRHSFLCIIHQHNTHFPAHSSFELIKKKMWKSLECRNTTAVTASRFVADHSVSWSLNIFFYFCAFAQLQPSIWSTSVWTTGEKCRNWPLTSRKSTDCSMAAFTRWDLLHWVNVGCCFLFISLFVKTHSLNNDDDK